MHSTNQTLAVSILKEVHKGNNSLDDLTGIFKSDPEFFRTLSDLNLESNPHGILRLQRPSYTYLIHGTESNIWSTEVHSFLRDHGYLSFLGGE